MRAHPDFDRLDIPQSVVIAGFSMDVLTAADLEEDYAGVMNSAGVLRGIFGPNWPDGLTKDYDETDLHWHHREFTAKRSFAWVLRKDGVYVGCAYLNPDWLKPRSGEAVYWIIDHPERMTFLETFGAAYLEWLKGILPDDYVLHEKSNAAIG